MHELTEEELALLAAESSTQEKPARRGRKPGPKRAGVSSHERPTDGLVDQPAERPAERPTEPTGVATSETPAQPEPVVEPAVAAPVGEQVDEQEDDKPEEQVEDLERAHTPAPARGPHTPAQYDDDGWGDVPVQMRG